MNLRKLDLYPISPCCNLLFPELNRANTRSAARLSERQLGEDTIAACLVGRHRNVTGDSEPLRQLSRF